MRGAMRARKAEQEFRRDMALLGAYFTGAGAYLNTDPKRAPSWAEFHARITSPPRKTTNAELIAFFRAHAEQAEVPADQEAQ